MPDGNAAAQRVLGIAKVLREIGYDVHFAGLSHNIKDNKESGVIDGFSYSNYPYPYGAIKWVEYLTGRDTSIGEIESYQPNLLILYNHPAFAIEHITKHCHKKGIKVIADVTEWYEPMGNSIFKAIKGYDTNRRMSQSHLHLDGLICISSYLTNFYRSKGCKVIEIPPLVDLNQAKWHQSVNEHPEEIRIMYAGSPGASKDRLDLILAALDSVVPNIQHLVRFDIVGITEQQYVNTWGDEQKRDYVHFRGRLPHCDVIKMLLEADFQIFLRPDSLPNRAGFPTKFVETITSRTLPITNLSSNLSRYLNNGQDGFVVSSLDKTSITVAIRNALCMTNSQIELTKKKIKINTFDYREYIKSFISFMNNM